VGSAAFSPDGTRVVTASLDKTARVWDAATGEPVISPLAHQAEVMSAVFSPDGTRVVTASRDNTARVWDLPLDDGTVADWASIAERSPFVLHGIAVMPRPPPSYLTPADASATKEAPRSTPTSSPPSPDEQSIPSRPQFLQLENARVRCGDAVLDAGTQHLDR
jgi:WD40 repeat protein